MTKLLLRLSLGRGQQMRTGLVLSLANPSCLTNGVQSVHGMMMLQSVSTERALHLCAFRGRSRHTVGFEPLENFELPARELLAAAGVDFGTGNGRLVLRPTAGSELFKWIESCLEDEEMAQVASRCVLVHGVFEVWGYGPTKEDAVEDAIRWMRVPERFVDASWSVSATSYGSSQLTREEEDVLTGGQVADFLSAHLKGPRTDPSISRVKVRVIEDLCPPPPPPFFATGRRLEKWGPAVDTSYRETEEQPKREKQFYICRVLQMGPAVGGRAEIGITSRRPKSGVLKTMALDGRKCKGKTAIEPEVALIMANLAKVQSRSRVLDPFCGSCSLLLPAAKLGASTWGADVAGPAVAASVLRGHGGMSGKAPAYSNSSEAAAFRLISASNEQGGEAGICVRESNELRDARVDTENLQGLYEDFERLGLVRPELVIGDVADEESAVRRPMFFDAIIADPPYSVKERVQVAYEHGGNATMFIEDKAPPSAASNSAGGPVDYSDEELGFSDGSAEKGANDSCSSPGDSGSAREQGWHDTRASKTVVAHANGLVRGVVSSLLSLARFALKPGGRLVFFLPLRGSDAWLNSLPPAVVQKLCEEDQAGGARLAIVYATKQRLKTPNICRWLVVLEKEMVRGTATTRAL